MGDEGRAAEKQPAPEVLLLLHGVTVLRLAGLDVMGQACVIKCLFLPPIRSPTNMGGWGRSLQSVTKCRQDIVPRLAI